jgi:TP901 family phage tail tape measure protein
MRTGFTRLGAAMRKTAKGAKGALGLTGIAGAAFLAQRAIGSVITTGAELEATLIGAGARFPKQVLKGTEAFKALEDRVREVGRTTEFTATQTAKSIRFLALAGFDAAGAMAVLKDLTNLATASETELDIATDIAATSLGAFGLKSKDAQVQLGNMRRLMDGMAKTSIRSRATVETLFETIKLGAGSAATAGLSLETFLAISGQLGSAALLGTRGGTAVINIVKALADPKTRRELKRMGVEFKTLSDGSLDFGSIISQLRTSLEDIEDPLERAGRVQALFDIRGGRGMNALMLQLSGSFETFKADIDDSVGANEDLAEILRKSTKIDIKLFKSAIESLSITLFKNNEEGIGGMITGLTEMTRGLDRFLERNPAVSQTAVGMGAVAATFLVVGVVIAAIGAAISFIVGSVVALVVAVFAASVAFGTWIGRLKPVEDFFDKLFGLIFAIPSLIRNVMIPALLEIPGISHIADFISGDESEVPDIAPGPEQRGTVNREESSVTLTVADQTGRGTLEKKGKFAGVDLVVSESGAFATP